MRLAAHSGSKAFAGAVLEESMREPMALYHISEKDFRSCKRRAEDYLAYVEYHIEQGGLLEAKGMTIGIVEGILAYSATRLLSRGWQIMREVPLWPFAMMRWRKPVK